MEQILVVKSDVLAPFLSESGLIAENTGAVLQTVLKHHEFVERESAETDRRYKQIIPYAVVRRNAEVFLLTRLSKTTESRLHGKLSLGIGGHINPDSAADADIIMHALMREIEEEVHISSVNSLRFCGIIHDTSSDVSHFHLGFLYILDIDGDAQVLETEKMSGAWVPAARLPSLFDRMETWSQVIVQSGILKI
jgi:predicted NUDIX family phosphoesterase